MEIAHRCQSCGMPLGTGFYGSDEAEKDVSDYCRFCFQQGEFTNKDLTLEQMIQTSVDHMKKELHFSEEKAKELTQTTIPHLKRWKK
ncbi:MAG: hypothetical protein ACD_28C00379G0007 [uncultured bacterium]|nr:MAG: hypothetical protein ACD_28C00379G0007 [uncultured bacterium]KKT74019.1 MAG: hypothetical protein UW70_C0069G0013 [Candidatus Peregrinibacteria bacterium GW2011_GWA2_44_7]